jgi:hypothetical protein
MTSQAQDKKVEDCDCPKPNIQQLTRLCTSIYEKTSPTDNSGLGYKYQEDLYEMSCVDLKNDSKEVAYQKIRYMWDKYKEDFRCYNFTGVSVGDANVLKFSIDTGFSSFLVFAVKKAKLDVNFKDYDGKSIMDFLKYGIERYSNSKYKEKFEEYNRMYKLLEAYGAKHGKDL